MRETVPEGPFDSQAANQFFTFYDQELGRLAAARGGFGLAALLLEQQGIQQGGGTSQSLSSSGSDRPIPDTSR
jgi:Rod binding domain-containing protein